MVAKALKSKTLAIQQSELRKIFEDIAQKYPLSTSVSETSIEIGPIRKSTTNSIALKNPETEKVKTKPSFKRSQTLSAFELTRLNCHRAENLTPENLSKAHLDVTGFDVIEPRFVGMTSDQWREFKRNEAEDCE